MTIAETTSTSTQAHIYQLMANVSIEVLPSQLPKKPEIVEPMQSVRVFIPYLPGSDLDDTIVTTRGIAEFHRQAVPHLPTRAFKSKDELSSWLSQIRNTGTDHLLLIAGDAVAPQGPFASTLDIIETELIEFYGFKTVFATGQPEGHPIAVEAALVDGLVTKRA